MSLCLAGGHPHLRPDEHKGATSQQSPTGLLVGQWYAFFSLTQKKPWAKIFSFPLLAKLWMLLMGVKTWSGNNEMCRSVLTMWMVFWLLHHKIGIEKARKGKSDVNSRQAVQFGTVEPLRALT